MAAPFPCQEGCELRKEKIATEKIGDDEKGRKNKKCPMRLLGNNELDYTPAMPELIVR